MTFWSNEEITTLQSEFERTKNISYCSSKLGRSQKACYKKLSKLGYLPHRTMNRWTKAETNYLKELLESGKVYQEIKILFDKFCLSNKLQVRTRPAIYRKAFLLGYRLDQVRDELDYLSITEVSAILGCSVKLIKSWIDNPRSNKILKAKQVEERTTWIIQRTNLKKFILGFRMELERIREPNLLGIVSLLCDE